VHGEQGRHDGLGGELAVEPLETLLIEGARVLAGLGAVDHDQSQGPEVRGVLDRLIAGPRHGEVAPERGPVVVVPREHEDGRVERPKQLQHLLVLGVGGVLGEVAAEEHGIGIGPHRLDRLDRGRQRGDRVTAAPFGAQMRIADLREQKRRAILPTEVLDEAGEALRAPISACHG
jgi:hypothetical protein